MKKMKSVLALSLAALMMFSAAACGKKVDNSSSNPANDDDLFADTEITISSDSQSGSTTGDGKTSNSTSGSQGSSGGSTGGSTAVGGKSWKDVLSSMPSSLRGTTLTVYNWNALKEYTGAPAAVKAFEKQTGITVKWITQNYRTYLSQLASKVAADQAPDLVRTNTPKPSGLLSLQSITATGYDFSDAAWDQQTMKDYTYTGKVYATSLKGTHVGSAAVVLYNKSLIAKYDLEDPYQLWKSGKWTFTKFLDIARAYKKASKADFAIGGGEYEFYANLYGVQGPLKYDGTKFVNMLKDSTFINITKTMADLRNTESVFRGWGSDEFNNGECLFWFNGAIYARKDNAYFQNLKSAGSLNIVPAPTIEGQSTQYQPMTEYEAYGISQGAKNAKAAPYFLRYFLDPANYDMNSFFSSKQALEVYNYAMSQPNRIWATPYKENTEFLGDNHDEFAKGYGTINGSQVITFFDTNYAVMDNRAKEYNSQLAKMQ